MMKNLLSYLSLLLCFAGAKQAAAQSSAASVPVQNREAITKAANALLFIPNEGQLEDRNGKLRPGIRFTAGNGAVQLFLDASSIHYQFSRNSYSGTAARDRFPVKPTQQQTHHFTVALQGSNPSPRIRREAKSITAFNYYTAHHPEGITGLASYGKLVYEEVYPHIDWVLYSQDNHLKYDFVVHPGGDPSLIRMKVKDADQVAITADGSMLMKTTLGEIIEQPPVSYIENRQVPTRFHRYEDGSIGFDVAAVPGKTLTIDPYVVWSTYYGGTGSDGSVAFCTTDAAGNVYMGGMTNSTNAIASGGFQNTYGGGVNSDAFLVKFDASGARLWATYYGGSNDERGNAGAVDASGNVYLAGETNSTGMSSGGFQNTYGGATSSGAVGDAFLVKFNSSGVRQWATYYGGSNDDRAFGCATDASGNVYLAGSTNSTAGIASGGFQNTYGGGASSTSDAMGDAFLVKFDASGARLWGTYYGGSDYEIGNGCATDASGNVYLVGRTPSNSNIASAGAFQATLSAGIGAFLVKFTAAGTRVWGTYYGNTYAEGTSCVADAAGNVYMAGHTSTNNNNIASGGFQNALGGGNDAFLAKFNASGMRQWGTYYGGASYDYGFSAVMDAAGFIYLCGQTQSTTGIASGGFQNALSGTIDAYIAKFNAAGVRQWGTYYGGTGVEGARSCAAGTAGSIYITGFTTSSAGIGSGGFQNTYGGGADAFLAKIREQCVPDTTTFTQTICNSQLPYTWQGNTLTAGGTHVAYHTFQNVVGCDSVVFLNLVVNAPVPVVHVYDTVCRNVLPVIWNNVSVNVLPSVNTATVNFTAAGSNGCDSVTTFHLFVRDSTLRIIDSTVCSTQLPFTWNNIVVSAGGPSAAVYHGFNTAGCDSTIRLNLTVGTPSATTDSRTICSSQLPYTWNNIIVTAGGNGVATYTTQNAGGCDSVVTLNLTVNSTSATTANITICTNELPYTWNGTMLTTGGNSVATYATTNTAGCDSIVTLNLTVSSAVIPTVTITASPGINVTQGTPVSFAAVVTNGGNAPVIQWLKNGLNVGTNSANYTDLSLDSGDVISCVLWSNAPCAAPDSAASNELILHITPPPPPCLVPVTLISTDIQFGSAVFKWAGVTGASGYEIVLDMLPSDPASGLFTTDTVYHASALSPGMHYFHIRTKCPNGIYSPWITITISIQDASGSTGIAGPQANIHALSLYPNPNSGVFHVAGIIDEGNSASIDIIDKSGRIIYRSQATVAHNKLDHEVRLDKASGGVYLLRIRAERQVYVVRFVLQ